MNIHHSSITSNNVCNKLNIIMDLAMSMSGLCKLTDTDDDVYN